MSRPLGLGPLRSTTLADKSEVVVVRQPVALGVGTFLMVVIAAFAAAILADPGETVNSGSGFVDRWFFGILVVPMAWGVDRFLLRPRVEVHDAGVELHNAVQTVHLPWPAVAGAEYDGRHLTFALTDHDQIRSVLFGPALSGPMTREDRPKELVALVNTESARRAGGTWSPDDLYDAQPLIGTEPQSAVATPRKPTGPTAIKSPAYGIPAGIAYVVAWTGACILAAL